MIFTARHYALEGIAVISISAPSFLALVIALIVPLGAVAETPAEADTCRPVVGHGVGVECTVLSNVVIVIVGNEHYATCEPHDNVVIIIIGDENSVYCSNSE